MRSTPVPSADVDAWCEMHESLSAHINAKLACMRDALLLSFCIAIAAPLAACGSESASPPSTQAPTPVAAPVIATPSAPTAAPPITPAPVPSTPPPTAPTPAPSATRRHHGPRLSAAQRASLAASLREGRQLTRAGQHREALTHFEAALAIAPGAWRVECETAFVAWRAEDAASADAHLHRALLGMPPGFVPEAQRVPTAMCLFNAGLIHQAGGRTDQAREVWEESIRLRPNATVSARLAALPPSTFTAPAWQSMPATTSLDVLLAAMRDEACESGLAGLEAGSDCSEAELTATRVSDDPADIEAYVVHGSFPIEEDGSQLYEALVVRFGDALFARVLGQAFTAEVAMASAEINVHSYIDDVLPGGRSELTVQLSDWGGSTDGESEQGGTSRHLIVCSVDTGTLQCFSVELASVSSYFDEETGEMVEEGFCRDAVFAEGRAIFERCPDLRGDAPPFIEGTHDLRMLLQRGDLRWPDVWQPLEPVGA